VTTDEALCVVTEGFATTVSTIYKGFYEVHSKTVVGMIIKITILF